MWKCDNKCNSKRYLYSPIATEWSLRFKLAASKSSQSGPLYKLVVIMLSTCDVNRCFYKPSGKVMDMRYSWDRVEGLCTVQHHRLRGAPRLEVFDYMIYFFSDWLSLKPSQYQLTYSIFISFPTSLCFVVHFDHVFCTHAYIFTQTDNSLGILVLSNIDSHSCHIHFQGRIKFNWQRQMM